MGKDGVAGGTGYNADTSTGILTNLILNSLTVRVLDAAGNAITGAAVTLYYPVNGSISSVSHIMLAADNGIYTFTNVPNGTRRLNLIAGSQTYNRWVTVASGMSGAADFSITQSQTIPSSPTALLVSSPAAGQLTLGWTNPTTNTDNSLLVDLISNKIYRSTLTGLETFLADTGVPVTNYVDNGLTPGEMYYYKVTAVNSAGKESDQSGEASSYASPVFQSDGNTISPSFGSNANSWNFNITNGTANPITLSSTDITWSFTGTSRTLRTILVGGIRVWTSGTGVSSPTGTLNFSPAYVLNAGATAAVRFTYSGNIRLSSLTVRINSQDGLIVVK